MDSYRILLSSISDPSLEDLFGRGEAAPDAINCFAPIAVPQAFEAGPASSKPWPNSYIDGIKVDNTFVLIIGSGIAKSIQHEYEAMRDYREPALVSYRIAQFGEVDVETFLQSLETKCDFEKLLHSLNAKYVRTRDGRLTPVQLAGNLDGKTVCLYRGGGIGDAIHYVRYARALESRGARVIVVCGAREAPLLTNVRGVDSVFPGKEASVCDPVLPDLPECDLGISFVAVPFACALHSDDICWPGPYVRVDTRQIEKARLLIGRRPAMKIGLCWESGGDGERVIPIRDLFPILRAHTDGVEFVSLQRGERHADDVRAVRDAGVRITDLETRESSLMDTAAVISNLDLVISVDTMICHLAGAIGKPIWTILPSKPDWRWSSDGEDTPWYPSMRLFRQGPDKSCGAVLAWISQGLTHFKAQKNYSIDFARQ